MKTRRQRLKSSVLITIFVMVVLMDLTSTAFTQGIHKDLESSNARMRVQANYALMIGQEIIRFLDRFIAIYGQMAPESWFKDFTDGLLKNGNAPIIIQVFYYTPGEEFKIRIVPDFVEPLLQNLELTYRFEENMWLLVSGNLPASYDNPEELDLVIPICEKMVNEKTCKGKITEYCVFPHNVKTPNGKMYDPDWCPLWHEFVMPPQ
jgi:hypothetical protein